MRSVAPIPRQAPPPPIPVAQAYLCRGCETLYRTRIDCDDHIRVFACGPCVPQYVAVTSSLPPTCLHERPILQTYSQWTEQATTVFQRYVNSGKMPEVRPTLVEEAGFERNLAQFASWWAEQPAAYKEAKANSPAILYARRHGFV
jgi:hypothetical protein